MKHQLEFGGSQRSSYQHIIAAGIVTRLDIAVDLIGIRIDDLDVRYGGGGKSHWYFSQLGQVETQYFGLNATAKDKNAPWSMYNKRQQLKANASGEPPDQLFGGMSHTRLEHRAKPNKPFPKLVGLANPFVKISLAYPTPPRGFSSTFGNFFWTRVKDGDMYSHLPCCRMSKHESNSLRLWRRPMLLFGGRM